MILAFLGVGWKSYQHRCMGRMFLGMAESLLGGHSLILQHTKSVSQSMLQSVRRRLLHLTKMRTSWWCQCLKHGCFCSWVVGVVEWRQQTSNTLEQRQGQYSRLVKWKHSCQRSHMWYLYCYECSCCSLTWFADQVGVTCNMESLRHTTEVQELQ